MFTMTSCRNSVSKRSTCAGTILSGYVPLSGHCSRLCVSSFMVGGRAGGTAKHKTLYRASFGALRAL